MVELREREVVGSNPGRAIPKALKMVPVATLLGAQHYKPYKASTGSPLIFLLPIHGPGSLKNVIAQKLIKTKTKPQHLVPWNPPDVPFEG